MTSINDRLKAFMNDLSSDPVEERVVEYIVREVTNGRSLGEVLDDPFVRNRLNDEKRAAVVENTEIVDAIEAEIRAAFKPDLGFSS